MKALLLFVNKISKIGKMRTFAFILIHFFIILPIHAEDRFASDILIDPQSGLPQSTETLKKILRRKLDQLDQAQKSVRELQKIKGPSGIRNNCSACKFDLVQSCNRWTEKVEHNPLLTENCKDKNCDIQERLDPIAEDNCLKIKDSGCYQFVLTRKQKAYVDNCWIIYKSELTNGYDEQIVLLKFDVQKLKQKLENLSARLDDPRLENSKDKIKVFEGGSPSPANSNNENRAEKSISSH